MTTIKKTIKNEIRRYNSIDLKLSFINRDINTCYNVFIDGDYDAKNFFFNLLHYLKMKRDYIYLKIYHDNIKKTLSNEKLLKYFESVLLSHGFNVKKL